jgi:hypothetical protein
MQAGETGADALEDAEMRDMRAGVVVWIWTGLGLE